VLSIEAAPLAARQKDSARVAGDLLSVPGVKIWDSLSGAPGTGAPGLASLVDGSN